MTINKILELLKIEALKGVNEVFIGNIWDVDNVAMKYPLMAIDNNARSHIFQEGLTTYSLDIYIVDITDQDGSDSLNIQSDMAELMKHFIDHMENNFDYFRILKDQGTQLSFRSFKDKWNDYVAGVKIEVSLIIPTNKKCINRFG